MILSISDHKAKLARSDRLRSDKPFCGPCETATGEINDLIACKRYDGPNSAYCPSCGEEYFQ